MAKKAFEVGQDVDAWCNKCKLKLAHVVIALKGTRPHRVQCKTCEAVHAYRVSKPAKRKRTAKAKPAVPSEYDRRMRGRDVSKASAYLTSATYSQDELIKHKTLGVGLVTELIGPTKVAVLFPDGPKRLVCGR